MSEKPLAGKTGLIFGVANKRSIAWAIAQAWHEAGAKLIFNYQGERLKENVEELAATFGEEVMLAPCDVSRDEELDSFFDFVKTKTDVVDLVLHSVAFAPKESLSNPFSQTTREQFRVALDISTYSLISLAQYAAPLMTQGGSIVAMTYLGSEKVLPNYNVMGVAKAGLEATARYLAHDLGEKNIRVNCISDWTGHLRRWWLSNHGNVSRELTKFSVKWGVAMLLTLPRLFYGCSFGHLESAIDNFFG